MKTMIITKKLIEKHLTMDLVICSVENGYKLYSQKRALVAPVVSLEVDKHQGEVDIKSGVDLDDDVICVKVASGFWGNPEKYDLPTGLATILLLDARNGVPLAVMDGGLITDMRTGAAGAISAKYMARKNSKSVAIIGTGMQGRMQLKALSTLFNLENVYVWGRNPEKLARYIEEMKPQYPSLNFNASETAGECVALADIVVTTTPSDTPLFKKTDIKPGTHIACIGTDMEGKQEIDENLFSGATIVVDSIEQCRTRGEIQHALKKNIIQESDVHAEIGKLILGDTSGRQDEEEITIFDSTGLSVQDITTAKSVYQMINLQKNSLEIELI